MAFDVYDLSVDVEWNGINPNDWRSLPEPDGDQYEDDEDDLPTPKYVVSILGIDPDELFED